MTPTKPSKERVRKYSMEDFIYWLTKYEDDKDKEQYTKSQIATNIAKAMLSFFDETDKGY